MSDHSEIPENLNKKLFGKILSNKFKETVEISKLEISLASKKGDNYTSDIYRIKVKFIVNGQPDEISLIAKYIKEEEETRKIFDQFSLISNENEMYEKILPKISEIIHEKCSAECFFVSDDPAIFIFEDLKALGYDIADRLVGLDFDHCKVFLKKIAKFHAASIILAEKDPDVFKNFKYGVYKDPSVCYLTYQNAKSSMNDVIEVAGKWNGFEEIVKKLKIMEPNLTKLIFKHVNLTRSDFLVLNHGDAWTNNFMFKYEENSKIPTDIAFVDYQAPFFSSFAFDYQYFMINSVGDEVRERHEDECLEIYFESLVETLKKFEYPKIPTIEQLKDELRRFQFFGLITALSVMPVILMEKEAKFNYNVDEFLNSQDFRKVMFNGKRCTKLLKYYLLKYDKAGILDI